MFVVVLEKPIRQGQQQHRLLVWQLKQDQASIRVNLEPDEIERRYGGALAPENEGPLHHLVAKLFKNLTGRKVRERERARVAVPLSLSRRARNVPSL